MTAIEIPSSIKSIGDYAFYGCSNVTAIEIPSSVTHVGEEAFSECSKVTSVEVPSTANVGSDAFKGIKNVVYLTSKETKRRDQMKKEVRNKFRDIVPEFRQLFFITLWITSLFW